MSNWVSCQKIVYNLHQSYQLLNEIELINFNYDTAMTKEEVLETAQQIIEEKPDVILILDHKPHPLPILKHIIEEFFKLNHISRFVFHIFGDFSLYYPEWFKLSKLLVKQNVEFICASQAQSHLINKYLINSHSHTCPFPVDEKEFFYRPNLRFEQRKAWGLGSDDIAYVFTGRLSRQKRIHSLLVTFSQFLIETNTSNAHLYLYGFPDHIGDSFLGKWETEGEYFRKINRIYKALPESHQSKIHFMGGVPNKELHSVYQGADYLVNISVHNDEDYGMSVAEALCSGLPTILTEWGGLSSFRVKGMEDATRFIPVKIGFRQKIVDKRTFINQLVSSFKNGPYSKRDQLSKNALKQFGIEAASKILKGIHSNSPQKFSGFNEFFKEVHNAYLFSPQTYINEKKELKPIYKKIYSSYVRYN